jgi:hypothetical protein
MTSVSHEKLPWANTAANIQCTNDLTLVDDTLYIPLLLGRKTPDTDFYWALYHHYDQSNGGYKLYIRSIGTGLTGWIAGRALTKGVSTFLYVIECFAVVSINPLEKFTLLDVVKKVDTRLNSIHGLTYRVWLFSALLHLKGAGLIPKSYSVHGVESGNIIWENAL